VIIQPVPVTGLFHVNKQELATAPAACSVITKRSVFCHQSLCCLPAPQVVSLGNNKLKGTLPESWADMRALGWLYLQVSCTCLPDHLRLHAKVPA
jgi:hypothetical protein